MVKVVLPDFSIAETFLSLTDSIAVVMYTMIEHAEINHGLVLTVICRGSTHNT